MGIGGKIKLEEGTAGGTYVGFKAPDTEVVSDLIWTLPSSDGTAGQLMATDGSMNIVWTDVDVGTETTARMNSDSTLQANINSLTLNYKTKTLASSATGANTVLTNLSYTLPTSKRYRIIYEGYQAVSATTKGVIVKDGSSTVKTIYQASLLPNTTIPTPVIIYYTMVNGSLTFVTTSNFATGNMINSYTQGSNPLGMQDENAALFFRAMSAGTVVGTLGKVNVYLQRTGTGHSGNVKLGLRKDNTKSTTPTYVSTNSVAVQSINTNSQEISFTFDPIVFTASDYFSVLIYYSGASGVDSSNYIAGIYGSTTGFLTCAYDGSTWGTEYTNSYGYNYKAYASDDTIISGTSVTVEDASGVEASW